MTDTKQFTLKDGTKTFSDQKVLFGTTVSISKSGRLASCSHLEWTSGLFFNNNRGKITKYDTSNYAVFNYPLGKCYKKDISEHTFSFLLENIFKSPTHPSNSKGKNT